MTVAALIAGLESVHRVPRAHELAVAGQRFSYPVLNAAAALLLVLATVGAAVLYVVLRGGLRELRAYRRFASKLGATGRLPGHPDVVVVDDSAPQAFCAGYLRPKPYVSRGAVALLSGNELDALLAHERRHARSRDPLRLACARVMTQALFFLPLLRPLADRHDELAEQDADRAAVAASAGDAAPLASALLAFEAAAPPGAAGISPGRVDSLLGRAPAWRLPRALTLASLLVLAGSILLIWRASGAAAADATFNLPVASPRPCVLVLALIAVLLCLGAVSPRRSSRLPG